VLDIKNKCLFSKWLFKILTEEGMWQELIQIKYLKDKTLSQVKVKPTDSPFWKGIMAGRDEFFDRGDFIHGDGKDTRFWEDTWLGRRRYHLNILLYIILLDTNMLEWLMCCPLLP
jgi:hypothetical protein